MELVTLYLCDRISITTNNISNLTFHNLKRNGWYSDARTSEKFTMLNKRIQVGEQWYRAMIRFVRTSTSIHGDYIYELSSPAPFLITECEPLDDFQNHWKDTKTYHGPKLGNIAGYVQAGIPLEVILQVINDIEGHVYYAN